MPEWGGQTKSVHIDINTGIGWSTCQEFAYRFQLSKNMQNWNQLQICKILQNWNLSNSVYEEDRPCGSIRKKINHFH